MMRAYYEVVSGGLACRARHRAIFPCIIPTR